MNMDTYQLREVRKATCGALWSPIQLEMSRSTAFTLLRSPCKSSETRLHKKNRKKNVEKKERMLVKNLREKKKFPKLRFRKQVIDGVTTWAISMVPNKQSITQGGDINVALAAQLRVLQI